MDVTENIPTTVEDSTTLLQNENEKKIDSTSIPSEQEKDKKESSSGNIISSPEKNATEENKEKKVAKELPCKKKYFYKCGEESDEEELKDDSREQKDKEEVSTSSTNMTLSEEYAKHVSYNEDGIAIYTDPKTNFKYKWSDEKNDWIPLEISANPEDTLENPYENEHYRWCSETNQWIPKMTLDPGDKVETEFYKWDAEKNQWIPKSLSSEVTYKYEDGLHTYVDNDGAIFFWDPEKNAWFPKIDDDFMARYQMNYGFIDNTSSDVNKKEEVSPSENSSLNIEETASEAAGVKRKAPQQPPKWFEIAPEQNTKVYVSNLPLDITEEEFVEVMGKCGMIMRDVQTHKYKVKLYSEPDGQLKGDGLCDYIKVESVELALNILDGYDVRGNKIKVQRAKFQMRGDYNPALKPKKKKKDKEKLQKMKEKLFDWRPEKMRGERSKHERVVIIKNLFEPEVFEKEVHLIIDYQNDLREECNKCGTVRKVTVFDRHPEGVAQIIMADPEEADLVVQMMQGRFFGKRKLTAEIWDGKTKYKVAETDVENKERLTNWDKYLEEENEKKKQKLEENPNEDSVAKESDIK